MQENVQLKEMEANPYRGLEHYPIQRARVDHLKESIQSTGLWPRLMGRRRKNKIQIAYGHHLKAALEELYGPNHKIPIEVREFTDSQMFQMMARENMTEWDSTPVQDLFTVKELLAAMDRGEIELPKGEKTSTSKRFSIRKTTGEIINQFLGWSTRSQRLIWIMDALDLMDAKLLKLKELEGLNENQVTELIGEISRQRKFAEQTARQAEAEAEEARKEREAAASAAEKQEAQRREEYQREKAQAYRAHSKEATRTIATEIASGLRAGNIATKDVRKKVFETVSPVPPRYQKPKEIPDINRFAEEVAKLISHPIRNADMGTKLNEIDTYQKHLAPWSRSLLIGALQSTSEWLNKWIERFDPKKNGESRTPRAKGAPPHQLK